MLYFSYRIEVKIPMYLTIKQQVKHLSMTDYNTLKELSHIAKNLTNQAIYNVRQYYFDEGKYLNYEKNYVLLKNSENYKLLNSNMAQQILKEVDGMFKSFFALFKLAKKGKYNYSAIRLPGYLPKDGYTSLIIGMVRLNKNELLLPFSRLFNQTHDKVRITIPPILVGKHIKEIRLLPKQHAQYFEIQYIYQVDKTEIQKDLHLNKHHVCALDLGVSNLITGVTNHGASFIIDGKRLKSINQGYHKKHAYLQRIRDKQDGSANKNEKGSRKKKTKRQTRLLQDRNNKVNDYMNKAARKVISYCLGNQIGTLVVGYNNTFQQKVKLGKRNNQTFLSIPFGKLRGKLEYLCELYGIDYIEQEESYTSQSSFFDQDILPTYNDDNPVVFDFAGKRVKRGLYQTASGYQFNADVNGALNILKKSNVVSLQALCARGEVDTPIRIRVQ